MEYKLLKNRGALQEGAEVDASGPVQVVDSMLQEFSTRTPRRHVTRAQLLAVPRSILDLVPGSLARELKIIPLSFDGETIELACENPDDLALADKVRFTLAKNVRLAAAAPSDIETALVVHYDREQPKTGHIEDDDVDMFVNSLLSEFEDTQHEISVPRPSPAAAQPRSRAARTRQRGFVPQSRRRSGMFRYTVNEGERVLMRRPDGTAQVLVGPVRVWRGRNTFEVMPHYVAHPGEFLIVRFLDGHQEHHAGPAEAWHDGRFHREIETQDALKISAKEAVVVYTNDQKSTQTTRRIVHGPTLFVPEPGEWLHTFSWHASKGGSKGAQKLPNGLVFQKLWLMPDQMYHDVPDVRTSDDAVLTIRLMIFYELIDIEKMLETTHDPIGDFVNAATADVVDFTGKHNFESFKQNTERLNDLQTYQQLVQRASQCGYRMNNVVYRGYGAPDSLQQMHNQAIEARTRLQLDRATEQQAQELENYRLESQLARSSKRRSEQAQEVRHDLGLQLEKHEAKLREQEMAQQFKRGQREQLSKLEETIQREINLRQQEHFRVLREMGVDLTAFLTQARADKVFELRGGGSPHLHLAQVDDNGIGNRRPPDQ